MDKHMKQCHTCKTYVKDEDDFCPTCRSSFDVKLCPAKHRNPVWAAYCGTCGSERLSRPHATGPAGPRLRLAVWIALGTLSGIMGLAVVVFVRWMGAGDSWQVVLVLFALGLLALAHVRMR